MARGSNSAVFFLSAVIVILLLSVSVVVLTKKNLELKNQLQNATSLYSIDQLEPGDRVTPFTAYTLDSVTTTIEYSDTDSRYLLLFLSTTCPYCLENLEKWRGLAARCGNSGCYVVGVSIHDVTRTRTYIIDHKTPFYTVSNATQEFAQQYKVRGVPMTMLITGGGIVEKVWRGALTPDQVEEIAISLNASPLH